MKIKKKNGIYFYTTRKPSTIPPKPGEKIKWKIDYRWRIYRNGRVIAASTQGYSRMRWAVLNVHSICTTLTHDKIRAAVITFNERYL